MFEKLVTNAFADAGVVIGGTKPWDIRIKKGLEWRFFRRVAVFYSCGLGKSYMDGTFECNDICEMLRLLMGHRNDRDGNWLGRFRRYMRLPRSLPEAWIRFQLLFRDAQSISASDSAICSHYDQGVGFRKLMLGPTETYSCGFFFDTDNVDEAQKIKILHTFGKLQLDPDKKSQVIEVGCGWGYAMAYLAKIYPNVTFHGITISKEQYERALEAHAELIAQGRLHFYKMDYRKLRKRFKRFGRGYFDAGYSIGMFEHVGPDYYRKYARIMAWCIKPGGRFVLHSIFGNGGIDPFIWYYIFKGGILPMNVQVEAAFELDFYAEHRENLGPHYAKTLRAWRMNIVAHWKQLRDMGYDEEFLRMYVFYLASCEVAFEIRRIHLQQWVFIVRGYDPERRDRKGLNWNQPKYDVVA
jgi:cyclopropane-fatty-acyl-phospholipid synthase